LGPRLAAFSSTSAPTLRAYLEGQAAYRRGQYDDAAAHFTRAIAYDSTFAPAGLGLAQVGSWTGRAHDWKRGIELAAATVTRLGERDQIFLNALAGNGGHEGTLLTANLNAWESAVETSPERPEVWHGFGNMLLAAGRAISPTAHQRARSAFQRAIELDPAFAPGLFQATRLAALASDTAAVRKLGTRYLELDSTSGASQYIRWRMALMLSDEATLRALRARFESFDKPTLRRIALTSQTDAVAPEDGERAIRAWLAWAVRSEDRFEALAFAHAFALNRGLAHDAADYTRALAELEPSPNFHLRLRITDALYAAGDSGAAARAAAELARVADASRTGRALGEGAAYDDLCALEQWRVAHGAYGTAPRAIGLLRESAAGVLPRWDHRTCALLLHAAVGVGTGAPDAAARVARLDSLLRLGPPLDELAPYANLAAARLHEALGDRERALEAVRRRRYAVGVPRYLSAQWLEEGRLADLADDREGAARAYERYRALASIPSPALALRRGAPRQATRAWAPAPAPR
jgi:tetratricopeptide (TPR) repeat protein